MNLLAYVVIAGLLAAATTPRMVAQAPLPQRNPFAQPTAPELTTALAVLRADSRMAKAYDVVTAQLKEPNKQDVLASKPVAREITVTTLSHDDRTVYEVTVDVQSKTITEFRRVPEAQPMIYDLDYMKVDSLLRTNPKWLQAMKRRNVDPDSVVIDAWATGIPLNAYPDHMARALSYVKTGGVNMYDRPIEGVVALVNITKGGVLEVVDREPVPVPPAKLTVAQRAKATTRKPMQALSEPRSNPNVVVKDGRITWGPWSLCAIVHPRDGMTLYDVRFMDGNVARRVAYRLSLSEMVVPYGDSAATWQWRNAFDVGEYGVGVLAAPLQKGVDVPMHAVLLGDAVATGNGKVVERKNILGVYEQAGGVLWKHLDMVSGEHVAARVRNLVVTQTSTVGNYDYAQSWILGLDGSIRYDVGLTGVLLAKGTTDTLYTAGEGAQKTAHIVDRNILAPTHQHFFCVRVDMDVDDSLNTVNEVDLVRRNSVEENPYGNAIMMDAWDFRFEKEAMTNADGTLGRTWLVQSTSKNRLGMPTGYALHPAASTPPYLLPNNYVRRRAAFVDKDLWVTRYSAEQLYAAGMYPNQSIAGEGLPDYVADNASILRHDVVLWHTFSLTHLARPEDWPLMPTAHAGFSMQPVGFFYENPTLDLQQPAKTRQR